MNFSLIVPCFNSTECDRRPFIDELLASLPDREDLEIILVDDHSPLAYTPGVEFKHSSLRQVPNDAGKKYAGSARNTGLSLAQGRIVFFADSDDRFLMPALEKALDAIADDENSDLFIARCTSFRDDESLGSRHVHVDGLVDGYVGSANVDDLVDYHAPWGKFIARRFIEQQDLKFSAHRVANDVLFAVNTVLLKPRVRVLDDVIYAVRQGNVSLTSDMSDSAVRTRLEVARGVQDAMRLAGREDLLRPLHYRFREYALSHPVVVLREMAVSIRGGYRVIAPPAKMAGTALRRLGFSRRS